MFGYIRPVRPQMKVCCYEDYKMIFEELQKTVKKQYGLINKVLLNYDFALLAMLESAYSSAPADSEVQDKYDLTAAVAVILMRVNVGSKNKFTNRLIGAVINKGYKKARMKYPELAKYIIRKLKKQAKLADLGCKSIDRASEPFADIVGEILARLSDKPQEKEPLRRVGFLLGRYVFIMNAFDNVIEDYENGGVNPLVIGNVLINEFDFDDVKKKTEHSVNFTIGALASAYLQLDFTLHRQIIDNIVYMGLKQTFYDMAEMKKLTIDAHDTE